MTNPIDQEAVKDINLFQGSSRQCSDSKQSKIHLIVHPLTFPFQNLEGDWLQLWKAEKYGMIASVVNSEGNLKIIPKNKILTPFNPSLKGDLLMERMESISFRRWDLVYCRETQEIQVLPHLEAEGKLFIKEIWGVPLQNCTVENFRKLLANRKNPLNHFTRTNKNSKYEVWESRKWTCHIDLNTPGHPPHIDIYANKNRVGEKEKRDKGEPESHLPYAQYQAAMAEIYKKKRGADGKEFKKLQIPKYRFILKSDKDNNGTCTSRNEKKASSPSKKQFVETLQKTGLVKSYNSSNPDDPVPVKEGSAGEIGGVGCSGRPIKGLFDTPESLFETAHSFFIPELDGEEPPFTHQELHQILQELAIGIYVHDTVPFFSLHFNEDAHLYPVIHPAYENTLVGQVFSMLDYYMKGYLNGGVFSEAFVKQWQERPRAIHESKEVLRELINFKEYAKVHLEGNDQFYMSQRTYLERIEKIEAEEAIRQVAAQAIGNVSENFPLEDPILKDLTKFTNSFRIIANQKKIEKTEDLFVLNWDFDVLYTIEPDPVYKSALEKHLQLYGRYPPTYANLEKSYENMSKRIHDHMVKMPLCKKYFSMLGVISFFSYYFKTLKMHHKVPRLPEVEIGPAGCPSLFPSLPLLETRSEPLKVNFPQVIKNVFKFPALRKKLETYLLGQADDETITSIREALKNEIWKSISQKASKPLQRQMNLRRPYFLSLCEGVEQERNVLGTVRALFDQVQLADQKKYKSKIPLTFLPAKFLQMIENLPNSEEIFCNYKDGLLILPSEQSPKQVEVGKKIVGGCGMKMEPKTVQRSSSGEKVLHDVWSGIQQAAYGHWAVLNSNDVSLPKGAAFQLGFEDIPYGLGEDKEIIESCLFSAQEAVRSSADEMRSMIRMMERGDRKGFGQKMEEEGVQDLQDREGRSLLHHAATNEETYFTEKLLESGFSMTQQDGKKYLPIHYAAMSGHVSQLELLLKKDRSNLNACSNQGATPLIVSIQQGKLEAMQFLLSKGAKGDAKLSDGYTALHCAAHQGQLEIVKGLLSSFQARRTIDHQTNEGVTSLMVAAQIGSELIVSHLIGQGADCRLKNKKGMTALDIAVRNNDLSLVKVLISRSNISSETVIKAIRNCSLEINCLLATKRNYLEATNAIGDTPLLMSLKNINVPLAKAIINLINSPAKLNIKNRLGESVVELAAKGNLGDILELLIQKRARIDRKALFKLLLASGYQGGHLFLEPYFKEIQWSESELLELLQAAAESGNHVAISDILVPMGVNLKLLHGPNGWKIEHYLAKSDGIFLLKQLVMEEGVDPMSESAGGKTLASIAAENGSWRVLSFLLEWMRKHRHSLQNQNGGRRLFYSLFERGEMKGIRLAMEKMQDSSLLSVSLDDKGTHAAHLAARQGSRELLEYLDSKRVDLSIVDAWGHDPLFYAIRSKSREAIAFLLEIKPPVPIRAESIYASAASENRDIFHQLVTAGAHLDQPSALDGSSPLMLSIKRNHLPAFKRLVDEGAALKRSEGGSLRDSSEWTPFLLAAYEGRIAILSIILSRHPEVVNEKFQGNNALHIACQRGHEACMNMLLLKGISPDEPNAAGIMPAELASTWGAKAMLGINPYKERYDRNAEDLQQAINEKNLMPITQTHLIYKWLLNAHFFIDIQGESLQGTLLHHLLHYCKNCEKFENIVEQICLDANFNPHIKDQNGNSYAHLMAAAGLNPAKYPSLNLEEEDPKGRTPLHIAAASGSIECLSQLIAELGESNVNPIDHQGRTPLFYAIQKNKTEHVVQLAKNGADLDHQGFDQITPLVAACALGHYLIVRLLVKYGASINLHLGMKRMTPLQIALESKGEEMALFLIQHGASLKEVDEGGRTIAHLAAIKGKNAVLRLIESKGGSLTAYDDRGMQPIHYAAKFGRIKTLALLESMGIYLESQVVIREKLNSTSITPLHLAATGENIAAVKWLLEHGADPQKASGVNILECVLQNSQANCQALLELFKKYLLSEDLQQILPAIVVAIAKDYIEPLKILYEMGISLETDLSNGFNGLHLACLRGALHCTEFFISQGVDLESPAKSGEKPLELAAANASAEQFRFFLNYIQPDIDQRYQRGETLLHIAVKAGNLTHTAFIIESEADLNIQDVQGQTPLFIAAQRELKDIVELLLIFGADPNLGTFFTSLTPGQVTSVEIRELIAYHMTYNSLEEETSLHRACRVGNRLAVKLSANQENINAQNRFGMTPLHLAVLQGDVGVIKELIRQGADTNLQDSRGQTPLALASCEGVVQVLLAAGADPLPSEYSTKEILFL